MTGRSNLSVIKGLLANMRSLTLSMTLAATMGLLANVATVMIMLFGTMAVLNVIGYETPLELEMLFIAMGASVAARSVCVYIHRNREHHVSSMAQAILRDKVFKALRRLCPAKLERHDKGDLINLITSDIEILESYYIGMVQPIVIAVLFCVIMVVFISMQDIVLGMLALISYMFIGAVIPFVTSKFGIQDGKELRDESGELSSYILDNLRGIREVQQYEYGEARLSGIGIRSKRLAKTEDKLKTVEGTNMSIAGSAIMMFDIMMIIVAVTLFREGTIAFDTMAVSIIAFIGSFGPFAALSRLGSTFKNTFAAGERILDLLDEEPVTDVVTDKPSLKFNGLSVRNVKFSYDTDVVLDGCSMEIEKDSIVGLMGPSGCGKSTLLKLIMRFWVPDEGKIKFESRDIDYINTKDLRDIEGYVTQESQIFHDTIRNNLLIAKVGATDEELEEACRKASVHDFIMSLPDGYDTEVGEMGDTLSAGERQRIGLARAFLHDSKLLLLDEPTSNLDSLNESAILKSLDEAREGRTVIIVSHTESTLRTADRILKMENGRIE